jgi:hypothetical protein
MYYKLYRNYLDVITSIVKNKYPIHAILRNGYQVTLHNYEETGSLTRFLHTVKNSEIILNLISKKTR